MTVLNDFCHVKIFSIHKFVLAFTLVFKILCPLKIFIEFYLAVALALAHPRVTHVVLETAVAVLLAYAEDVRATNTSRVPGICDTRVACLNTVFTHVLRVDKNRMLHSFY